MNVKYNNRRKIEYFEYVSAGKLNACRFSIFFYNGFDPHSKMNKRILNYFSIYFFSPLFYSCFYSSYIIKFDINKYSNREKQLTGIVRESCFSLLKEILLKKKR